MKILLVSYYYPPLNSVASLRPHNIARALSANGHDVEVVTTGVFGSQPVSHATPRVNVVHIHSPLHDWISARSLATHNSRTITPAPPSRLWSSFRQFCIDKGIGMLGRMPDLTALWARAAKKYVKGHHYDLVISTYAPYSCHAIGYFAKHNGNANKWIADYRDLWSHHHMFPGLFPFNRYERFLERRYLKRVDHVTTVSAELASQLESHFGQTTTVINTGFDPQEHPRLQAVPGSRPRPLLLAYTGTLYPDNPNQLAFLSALAECKKLGDTDNLEILLLGTDLANMKEKIDQLDLRDVVCLQKKTTRKSALEIQAQADVLLFFDYDYMSGVTSGKIFEYLNAGKPIWRISESTSTPVARIIEKTRTGLKRPNESLAETLSSLNASVELPRLENPDIQSYAYSQTMQTLHDLVADEIPSSKSS